MGSCDITRQISEKREPGNSNHTTDYQLFLTTFIRVRNLLLILFVLFCTCQLIPQEEIESAAVKRTTMQIQNKVTLFPVTEYIDGSLWEVQVYCFNEKSVVVNEIAPVPTGTTSVEFIIPDDCESVKVSWKFAPVKSQYYFGVANCRRYSGGKQTVKKNSNTLLIVDKDWSAIPGF